PMPSARHNTEAIVSPGALPSVRSPYFKSCQMVCIGLSLDGARRYSSWTGILEFLVRVTEKVGIERKNARLADRRQKASAVCRAMEAMKRTGVYLSIARLCCHVMYSEMANSPKPNATSTTVRTFPHWSIFSSLLATANCCEIARSADP